MNESALDGDVGGASGASGEPQRTTIVTVTPTVTPGVRRRGGPPCPAFFLDRDGVVVEEKGILREPGDVTMLPRVARSIREMKKAGFVCCVVTNQSGLARGKLGVEELVRVHEHIDEELERGGARIDAYYVCPHHSDPGMPSAVAKWRVPCDCRKPEPGMLRLAAAEWGLDLGRSFLIGDKLTDLQAGAAVGCRTVMVRSGHGRREEPRVLRSSREVDLIAVVDSLDVAVRSCLAVHLP